MRPSYFKRILDLRPKDFERHTVWVCAYNTDLNEPWYDDDPADEATYRPWDGLPPYDCYRAEDRSARVAATFTLANAMELAGFCHPPMPYAGADGMMFRRTQPLVFLGDMISGFWAGASEKKLQDDRSRLYSYLRMSSTEIFPIRYRISREVVNVDFVGEIEGFGRLLPPDHTRVIIER